MPRKKKSGGDDDDYEADETLYAENAYVPKERASKRRRSYNVYDEDYEDDEEEWGKKVKEPKVKKEKKEKAPPKEKVVEELTTVWENEVERILAIRHSTKSRDSQSHSQPQTQSQTQADSVTESDTTIIKSDGESPFPREVLIKFKGISYRDVTWESEALVLQDHVGNRKLKNFIRNHVRAGESEVVGEDFSIEDVIEPEWQEVERIVASRVEQLLDPTKKSAEHPDGVLIEEETFLVKWKGLNYTEATWEFKETVEGEEIAMKKFEEMRARNSSHDGLMNANGAPQKKKQKSSDDRVDIKEKQSYRLSQIITSDNGKLGISDIEIHNITLRDYQVEGVTWLLLQWCQCRSGSILADEMGLGKTIQSNAFLETLRAKGCIKTACMIVIPLSTIRHWQMEYDEHTNANVVVFHGNGDDREIFKTNEFTNTSNGLVPNFDVMITTYETVCAESAFLKKFQWDALVVDEAHRLKNDKTQLRSTLEEMSFGFRLLLTGTPIQNNMEELFSLLNFTAPTDFGNKEIFLAKYGDMHSEQQVQELQTSMRPYMLRREKKDVELSIPKKVETIVDVELTAYQKKYYRAILEKNRKFLGRGTTKGLPSLLNVLSELRKVCNHPYLVRGGRELIEEDDFLDSVHVKPTEENAAQTSASVSGDATNSSSFSTSSSSSSSSSTSSATEFDDAMKDPLVYCSGKIVLLHKLLPKLKKEGSRALIFSQFSSTLDIIGEYLNKYKYSYERIDGSIMGQARISAIKRFSSPTSTSLVFLLTTRAGGLGLNLQAADTVIIFDSDWNPQGDLQAIARSHRLGQSKDVKVYRLLTRKTAEQELFRAANKKLGLTNVLMNGLVKEGVEGEDGVVTTKRRGGPTPKDTARSVDDILKNGAYALLAEDETASVASSNKFMNDDIDHILNVHTKEVVFTDTAGYQDAAAVAAAEKQGQSGADSAATGAGGEVQRKSLFAQVTFMTDSSAEHINLNDADFWEKVLPKANSKLMRMKKMFVGEGLAELRKSTKRQDELLAKIISIAEEVNHQRQSGNSHDDTQDVLELLGAVIESNVYPEQQSNLINLRHSIENPKRHRSSRTNVRISEIATDGADDSDAEYFEESEENSDEDEEDEEARYERRQKTKDYYGQRNRFGDNALPNSAPRIVTDVQLFARASFPIYSIMRPQNDQGDFKQYCINAWDSLSDDERQAWNDKEELLNKHLFMLQCRGESYDVGQILKDLTKGARERIVNAIRRPNDWNNPNCSAVADLLDEIRTWDQDKKSESQSGGIQQAGANPGNFQMQMQAHLQQNHNNYQQQDQHKQLQQHMQYQMYQNHMQQVRRQQAETAILATPYVSNLPPDAEMTVTSLGSYPTNPVIGSIATGSPQNILWYVDLYAILPPGPLGVTLWQKQRSFTVCSSKVIPHPGLVGHVQFLNDDHVVAANGRDIQGLQLMIVAEYLSKCSRPLTLILRRYFKTRESATNWKSENVQPSPASNGEASLQTVDTLQDDANKMQT